MIITLLDCLNKHLVLNRIFQSFLTLLQIPKSSLQFESNTEHDGDIEDISDGERTNSDHGMTFYPNVPGTPT